MSNDQLDHSFQKYLNNCDKCKDLLKIMKYAFVLPNCQAQNDRF